MAVRKLTQKESAEAAHLVAICSVLIVENIDSVMEMNPEAANEIKKQFETVSKFCEIVSEATFGVKEIYSTTYIQELSNKVNTVIRKNAKFIPEK